MLKALLLAGAMFASVLPAKAVTLLATDIGATGTTTINGFVEPVGVVPGLTSSLTLTYTGLSDGGLTWNFDYTLANTGTLGRVSSFGLNVTPQLASASSTGLFSNALLNVQAGFLGLVDFCASVGPQCGGGGGGGLLPGQSASGSFDLTFSTVLASILLDAAFSRYQAIDGSIFNLVGASGFGINTGVNINPLISPVPIPGALVLFLSGLVGLGWLGKLRGKRVAQPAAA